MTPFRNDAANSFLRPSIWPGMPHTPLQLGIVPPEIRQRMAQDWRGEQAWRREQELLKLATVAASEPAPRPAEPQPPASIPQPPPTRAPRFAPLIAAGLVGAGGLLALFWLIGPGAPR